MDGLISIADEQMTGFTRLMKGKVREVFSFENNLENSEVSKGLVMISTDRLSAFDVVFGDGIPNKGRVLTQMADFWFSQKGIKNHLIFDQEKTNTLLREGQGIFKNLDPDFRKKLIGRTMVVKQLKMLPVEAVVRGYLMGSAFKEYKKTGAICGINLPEQLPMGIQFKEPLFTPSTKAEYGLHDENISFEKTVELIGQERAEEVRAVSIRLYKEASERASKEGFILVDTKFEFGLDENDQLVLADEALTPDSSRYWQMDSATLEENAEGQKVLSSSKGHSYDKQLIRDYLETCDWNKEPPAPQLPADIVSEAQKRYQSLYEKMSGKNLVQN